MTWTSPLEMRNRFQFDDHKDRKSMGTNRVSSTFQVTICLYIMLTWMVWWCIGIRQYSYFQLWPYHVLLWDLDEIPQLYIRHWWSLFWDHISTPVPDDIRAPEATEGISKLRSKSIWVQDPQAIVVAKLLLWK